MRAVHEKSADAPKVYETVSKLAADPEVPPEYRELGKVLQKYMGDVKNPNLSNLPEKLAEIVRKALE